MVMMLMELMEVMELMVVAAVVLVPSGEWDMSLDGSPCSLLVDDGRNLHIGPSLLKAHCYCYYRHDCRYRRRYFQY